MILRLKRKMPVLTNYLIFLVPGAGIEPAQPQGPRDFKSLASTSFATRALRKLEARAGVEPAYMDLQSTA